MSKTRRFARNKLVRIALIAFVVIALPLTVNATTPIPGAAVARFFIGLHGGAKPPANYQDAQQHVTVAKDVVIDVADAPQARLDIYTPKQANQESTALHPLILWIHGGGFVGSGKADTAVYATLLAHEGYTVASLEFTRPPDARYPVPIRQANAALRYLSQHAALYQGDASRVFVAGNSSGAQIASQTVAVETNQKLADAMRLKPALQPGSLRGAVLNCGAYDMAMLKNERFPFLRVGVWSYTGHRDWMKFSDIDQLSTIHHVTAAYPPVFLAVGDADPLEPQSVQFEAALREHSVPVTTQFWHGSGRKLGHDYQFELDRPEAQETLKHTVSFLNDLSKKETN